MEGGLVKVTVKESIFRVLRLLHFYHKPLKKQVPNTQILAFLRSSDQLLHRDVTVSFQAKKKIKVGLKWGLRWV